jgi:hypothetical protein
MTRPTLAKAITIDEFWKNRAGQAVKISLSTFQGRNLIDVRTWGTDPAEGRLKPTVKGFAAELRHLPRLVSALTKAESRTRELGLIENNAEDAQ